MGFSKDFLWGTATASYQIEGGALRTEEVIRYGMISAGHQEKYFPCIMEISRVTIITNIKKM